MEVIDFVDVIERHIQPGTLDYVIVNNGAVNDDIIRKYRQEENKRQLTITDYLPFQGKSYKVIERNLVNDDDYIRHDPLKLGKILNDIMNGWIK